MAKLKAFVGHSFTSEDEEVVNSFIKFFNSYDGKILEWTHAEKAEPKKLAIKVKEKMEGRNLFIGIFTVKNKMIDANKLKPAFLRPATLKAKADDFVWSTSAWVIQECGYALAKEMKTILLVEKGIASVGGLHGDTEYIYFNRYDIDASFQKLNEMIMSLVPEGGELSERVQLKEQAVKEEGEFSKVSSDKEDADDKRSSFKELFVAIKSSDETKENEAFKKFLEAEGDGTIEIEVDLTSSYYWLRYRIGEKDILEDLLTLSENNPQHPSPHKRLGNLLEEYKQYEKAASHYIIASELSSKSEVKSAFICRAAESFMNAGKVKEGKELLLDYIGKQGGEIFQNYEIYKTLANIQKEAGNYERFFSLAEKAIDIKPTDNNLRFDLAYAYSEKKNHIMALHHYKIICSSTPDESSWNNLGAKLDELEMKGKAIKSYLMSKEMGGTHAIGNLAYKLMDVGYFEMAKEYLHEALNDANCSSNVSNALSDLEGRIATEEKIEKEYLEKSPPEIKFRVRYAEAYIQRNDVQIQSGQWKSPHGDVEIMVKGNAFKAHGEFEIESFRGLGDIYASLGGFTRSKAENKIKKIEYEGVLINGIVDYTLTVTTNSKGQPDRTKLAGSLLGTIKDSNTIVNKFSGLMIIEQDGKSIEVMERDSKANVEFYTIMPVGDK